MTFAHPHLLALLALPAALLALALASGAGGRARLSRLVGAGLEPRLLPPGAGPLRAARAALTAAGLALGIAALAGPRWGETLAEVRQKGRDVILAIDVSRSMLARDAPPDRLTRAKLLGQDFLARLRSDRAGVVAFAGTAFLQAPLTIDYGAVAATLQELDPSIIPRGGTNIAAAIAEAVRAFGKAEGPNRLLVIISDGEELDADAVAAARAAREAQIRVDTVGIGTPEGDLIPVPDAPGQFVRGPDGEIVRTRLDESRLAAVAEAGGGVYRRFQPGADQAGEILAEAFGSLAEREGQARTEKRPIERYQWPLAAALALLTAAWLLPERLRDRKTAGPSGAVRAAALAAALALAGAAPLSAAESAPPEKLYAEGRFEEAARAWAARGGSGGAAFTNAFNRGCALYRAGKFAEAAEAFAEALRADRAEAQAAAHYNLGNALYREAERQAAGPNPDLAAAIESVKNAIAQYDAALRTGPGRKEAAHNRSVAERRLKELEELLKQQQEREAQQQKNDRQEDQKKDQQQQKAQKGGQQQEGGQKDQKDTEKNQPQEQGGSGKAEDQAQNEPQSGGGGQQKPQQGRGGEEARSGRDQAQRDHDGEQNPDQEQEERGQPRRPQEQGTGGGGKDEQERRQQGGAARQPDGDQPGAGGQDPQDAEGQADQPGSSGAQSQAERDPRQGEDGGQLGQAGAPSGADQGGEPGPVPKIEREGPLEGEIRAAGAAGGGAAEPSAQDADGLDEGAAPDGKMTAAQARRLIESLRSEEQRVILRGRVRPERAYRDW